MKNKFIIFSLAFILILTSGFGCAGEDKQTKQATKPITLNYWRVWDGPDAFQEIIDKYQQIHPYITIKYRKLRYNEYEKALIEAFAVDKGPDILSLHNTWMRKYQSKGLITPMPAKITMAYPVVKGSIKKEVVTELRAKNSISLKAIKDDFVDVVYDDVVIKVRNKKTNALQEQVFGLPLSVDTLAMFYNKDLFNNAGITEPPAYWNREFQQNVKKLTKQNNKGQIIQSGVALGGNKNITRSTDILSVLMMQNGATMMENGQVKFHQIPDISKNQGYNPGMDALRFYTDFANPAKEVYGWNKAMNNSLDMFIHNKLAIMFGYSYFLPQIKAQAPKLNFNIIKLPQIEGNMQDINIANYWAETVSKKSKHAKEAWDFVQFMAKPEQAKLYFKHTKKPTALRALIKEQINNDEVGVFADQILTAKSWYKGNNANAAEKIMGEMIERAVAGREELISIINSGASKIQQTVQ